MWIPVAVGLAGLNPLLMDFFACARGYSLALAFLMWGALCLMQCVLSFNAVREPESGDDSRKPSWKAGALGVVFLGLCFVASFPFAIPAAALGALFLLMLWRGTAPRPRPEARSSDPRSSIAGPSATDRRGRRLALFGLLGAVAVAVIAVAAVLVASAVFPHHGKTEGERISFGYDSWRESATDLLDASLLSRETARMDIPGDPAAAFPPAATIATVTGVVAALIVTALFTGVRVLRRGARTLTSAEYGAFMISGCALLSGGGYVIGHALIGLKYPTDRVVLYLVPLASLGVLLGLQAWRGRPGLLAGVVLVVCLAVIGRYATELNVSRFRSWGYDADSREVFLRMQETAGNRPPGSVRPGGDWHYEPSMNFYRLVRRADWMMPYQRVMEPPPEMHDFLLYSRTQAETLDAKGFDVVCRGRLSGIVLYANRALSGGRGPQDTPTSETRQ